MKGTGDFVARHKWTVFYNAANGGYSESYVTPIGSYATLAGHLEGILSLRALTQFSNTTLMGVRVSEYSDATRPSAGRRRSRLMLPPTDVYPGDGGSVTMPVNGQFGDPSGTVRPDQIRAALHLRCTFDDTRTAIKYLDGVPDRISGFEPGTYVPSGDPAWVSAFTNWRNALLVNAFALEAADKSDANPVARIIGLRSQGGAPGYIGVVYTPPAGWTVAVGDRVAVHAVRVKPFTFQPPLNGTWVVDSIVPGTGGNPDALFLRSSQNYDPDGYTFGPLSTVRKVQKAFYPLTRIDPIRVGIHKRGVPGPYLRGRRKSRQFVVS